METKKENFKIHKAKIKQLLQEYMDKSHLIFKNQKQAESLAWFFYTEGRLEGLKMIEKKMQEYGKSKTKEIKKLEFCPICVRVLKEKHICQGLENQDNQWK